MSRPLLAHCIALSALTANPSGEGNSDALAPLAIRGAEPRSRLGLPAPLDLAFYLVEEA
ncbi:MAG: hypothetical protein H0V11_02875 [Actinobacteria bacterium]|nr:hypothetical protein [Actinomycetota bacterium]